MPARSTPARERRPKTLPSAVDVQILIALAESPMHGYGIKRAVAERTGGALHLGPGTLYEAMRRLNDAGWIEDAGAEAGAPEEGESRGAPRRVYRLTELGRAELRRELARLAAIVEQGRALRLVPGKR